jgi:hypothetical protein
VTGASKPSAQDQSSTTENGNNLILCETCNSQVSSGWWANHMKTASHRRNEKLAAQQEELIAATVDKNGVKISANIDFGIVELGGENVAHSLSFAVTKTDPSARILLLRTVFSSASRNDDFGYVAYT